MLDMQTQLEKLRSDAAECTVIRDLSSDPAKRELFTRLADHLTMLACDIEAVIAAKGACRQDESAEQGKTA